MYKYVITAQIRNLPDSKIYLVGWRNSIRNLVIEKTYTERTAYFEDLRHAHDWLVWALKYLPSRYTYRIVEMSDNYDKIINELKCWTQPIWSRYIASLPGEYIMSLPHYFKKEHRQ